MSRWEFMRQLEELLSDISPNEREEALQYYNDYFNDAGRENEKEVIKALGSPAQVAKIVKDGLSENGSQGEFTESGFTSTKGSSGNELIKRSEEASQKNEDAEEGTYNQNVNSDNEKGAMPAWEIVLIGLGCILLSPFLLAAVCALSGLLLGVIAAILSIVFGFGVAMLVLFVVAVTLFIAGIGCIVVHPAAGLGLIGSGCICVTLGILFMLLVGFLSGVCIPGICKGIVYICKKLFGKKEGVGA